MTGNCFRHMYGKRIGIMLQSWNERINSGQQPFSSLPVYLMKLFMVNMILSKQNMRITGKAWVHGCKKPVKKKFMKYRGRLGDDCNLQIKKHGYGWAFCCCCL